MNQPGITPSLLGLKRVRTDPLTWLNQKLQETPGALGLAWTLNMTEGGLEAHRRLVAECLSKSPVVYAIARTCDSGAELIAELVRHGLTPEKAAPGNLSSRDVANLRPSSAMFIESLATYKRPREPEAGSRRMYAFVQHVRKATTTLDDLPFELSNLTTKLLDVGLSWERK